MLVVNENTGKHIPSEPEYITAECVRQKKLANAASLASQHNIGFNSNNGMFSAVLSKLN